MRRCRDIYRHRPWTGSCLITPDTSSLSYVLLPRLFPLLSPQASSDFRGLYTPFDAPRDTMRE